MPTNTKGAGFNRRLFTALCLLVPGAVCLAYLHHFNNPFQYDDNYVIVNNPYVTSLHNIPLFFTDAGTSCIYPPNQVYRPLTMALHAIDCRMGGTGQPIPLYYHCNIFIAYLLFGVFLYPLAVSIYNKALRHPLNPYIALLTTAVFMLHTANAETINYIYERTDLESTLLVLVTLCCFIYFPKLRKYQLYIIPMLIGMLLKEPAILAAPLIFLYLFLFEEKLGFDKLLASKTTVRLLWMLAPAFLLGATLFYFMQKMTPARWSNGHFTGSSLPPQSVFPYLCTQFYALLHYARNFILPNHLAVDSDWTLMNPFNPRVITGFVFVISTLYLAYRASLIERYRPIAFGIVWFYLGLAPTSSIIPQPEVMIDHREFFGFIGLAFVFTWGLFLLYIKFEPSKYLALLLVACFLTAHVYGVRQRCECWGSEESLWHDAAIKSPNNGRVLATYGKALLARKDYGGAYEQLNKARQKWPRYAYAYMYLGMLYHSTNRQAEAEQNFKYALQLDPDNGDAYFYYATAMLAEGKSDAAKLLVEQGLNHAPNYALLIKLKKQLYNARHTAYFRIRSYIRFTC